MQDIGTVAQTEIHMVQYRQLLEEADKLALSIFHVIPVQNYFTDAIDAVVGAQLRRYVKEVCLEECNERYL